MIYSIRKENKQLAHSIARQIRSQCPKENERELKRLFNIAINLKSIEEIKEEREIEDLMVEKECYDDDREEEAFCEKKAKKRKKKAKMRALDYEKDEIIDECCYKRAIKCCDYDDDLFGVDSNEAEKIIRKAKYLKKKENPKNFVKHTQYYNQVFKDNDYNSIINPNHFFADLAQFWSENDSIRNIGFKSENILIKPNNITELIFILSVLDLEEKTIPKSQTLIKDKGLGLTIECNTNTYLLTKEINETQLNMDNKYALILAQMVFEDDKNNKEEKEPSKFLTNRTYIQKTIITNISSVNINCEILMQIPEGSIQVNSDEYKIIETANIKSYKSEIFEQKFYFPQEGLFKQYPASASINDLVIAKSGLKTYEVVTSIKLGKNDITSIDDVLNQGNKKEILEFINKRDVIKERRFIQNLLDAKR